MTTFFPLGFGLEIFIYQFQSDRSMVLGFRTQHPKVVFFFLINFYCILPRLAWIWEPEVMNEKKPQRARRKFHKGND